jgi:Ca-activated chloride channel family protein
MRKKYLFLFLISLFLINGCDTVRSKTSKGIEAFESENYEEAVENFEKAVASDRESDLLNYNLGTAFYKKGDPEKAKEYLQKALLSEDPDLKERAHYNLGNSMYRSALNEKDRDIDAAITKLEQAAQQYEGALSIKPEDDDAKNNLDITRKKIEELKKLREQQKEQQKQGQQNKEQQDKQDQGSQSQNSPRQSEQEKGDQQQQAGSSQGQQEQNQQKQNQDQNQQSQQQDQSGQGQTGKDGQDNENDKEQPSGNISALNGNQEESDYNDEMSAGVNEADLEKQEAQRLLQTYQEKEEPKGMPVFMRGSGRTRRVEKDW